jgi:hypothetical protein
MRASRILAAMIVALTIGGSTSMAQEDTRPTVLPVAPDCERLPVSAAAYVPTVSAVASPVNGKSKLEHAAVVSVNGKDKRLKSRLMLGGGGLQTLRLKPSKRWTGLTLAFEVDVANATCAAPLMATLDGTFSVFVQSGQLFLQSLGQELPGPSVPVGTYTVMLSFADKSPTGTGPVSVYVDGVLADTLSLPAGWFQRRAFGSLAVASGPTPPGTPCPPSGLRHVLVLGRPAEAGDVARHNMAARRWCKQCCEQQFVVFNTLADTVATIEIAPVDPLAIIDLYPEDDDEEDSDWTITRSGGTPPTSYTIQPADGGFFPADPLEAEEVAIIAVDSARAPTDVVVTWRDSIGQVVKSEKMTLFCPRDLARYEDDKTHPPLKRTSLSGASDTTAYSATVPMQCNEYKDRSTCGFKAEFM